MSNIGNIKENYSIKKIDKIITQIQNDAFFKGTLGGCIIEKVNQTLIITKET